MAHNFRAVPVCLVSDVVACSAAFTGHSATISLRVASSGIKLNGRGGKYKHPWAGEAFADVLI